MSQLQQQGNPQMLTHRELLSSTSQQRITAVRVLCSDVFELKQLILIAAGLRYTRNETKRVSDSEAAYRLLNFIEIASNAEMKRCDVVRGVWNVLVV